MSTKPRILLFDVENAPNIAYTWALYQDINSMKFIKENWFMMCWCAKWLGDKKVHSSALPDFDYYKKHPKCDRLIMKALRKLLDEADIVIAHNGARFDVRKANARFIVHGIEPPSPYRIIDTLKEARKHFMFTSNRLDDLGRILGVGRKIATGGFELWVECLEGNKTAWNKMVKYCKQDVLLLERVYKKLLPYMTSHPNLSIYLSKQFAVCGSCGSGNIMKNGHVYTQASKYQRYKCKDCYSSGRYVTNVNKKDMKKQTRSIK